MYLAGLERLLAGLSGSQVRERGRDKALKTRKGSISVCGGLQSIEEHCEEVTDRVIR